MAQPSARRTALAALRAWRTEKRFADSIITKLLAQTELDPRDRAFILELFYGVLRNATLLDFWIASLRQSPLDVDLRDLLRLGLYQLFFLKTPEHAAVHETVELAPKSRRALINAILRTAARLQDELRLQASKQSLAIRTSHQRFLVARWEQNFGPDAAEALCTWNNRPPPLYARINRLKIGRQDFRRAYPEALSLSVIEILWNFVRFQPSLSTRVIPKELFAIAPFDRVLIDAPCSNTGVMRRRVDVRWRIRAADLLCMQEQQLEIVRTALGLLKTGGVFVYSTCSLEPEENEKVVQQLLREFANSRQMEARSSLPFRDGFDGAFAAKLIRAG